MRSVPLVFSVFPVYDGGWAGYVGEELANRYTTRAEAVAWAVSSAQYHNGWTIIDNITFVELDAAGETTQ
jgi:hypothetical protein